MPKPKKHIFVCGNRRPPQAPMPSCGNQGAQEIMMELMMGLQSKNLVGEVAITTTGCLGPCMSGPVMVVYPDNVWYGKVAPADVKEIIDSHIVGGTPVARLHIMED